MFLVYENVLPCKLTKLKSILIKFLKPLKERNISNLVKILQNEFST